MYNRKKSKTIWIVVAVVAAVAGVFFYLKRKGKLGHALAVVPGGKK